MDNQLIQPQGATRRVIIVTGGSRGIGRAIVLKAAAQGDIIVWSYLKNHAAAKELQQEIQQLGGEGHPLQTDVSNEAGVLKLFAFIDLYLSNHPGQLYAVINNAGNVALSDRVENYSEQRLTNMFALNVIGPFLCAREAIKRMSTKHKGKGGVIINLSSIAASLGSPGEYVDYAASKGALDTFTVGLAKEVANEGIRVNAVRPGLIDTDLHANSGDRDRPFKLQSLIPMQRVGSAEDVANAVVWLMSDEASYITGNLTDVSGGR